MLEIRENYRGWQPPIDLRPIVARLLSRVPQRYLAGLGAVVLTFARGMSHSRRRRKTRSRGRKVSIVECRGLYHPKWDNEPAWIELFVDNILRGRSAPGVWLPPIQDDFVGDVLFHELGHHLHYTQAREHRETEAVAADWQFRLLKRHVFVRSLFWLPILLPSWVVQRSWKGVDRLVARLSRRAASKGDDPKNGRDEVPS